MKIKIISITLLLFLSIDAVCQINIIETTNKEESTYSKYDSTYNSGSLKQISQLVGQTIYLIPFSKEYKGGVNKYSSGFLTSKGVKVKNPQRIKNVSNVFWSKKMNMAMAQKMAKRYPDIYVNTYKPVKVSQNGFDYATPLDSVLGRYYIIKGIVENPHLTDYRHDGIFFDLVSINAPSDSLLYKISTYNAKFYNENPNIKLGGDYIVQGYYKKLEKQFINKKFIFLDTISKVMDIKTGEIIQLNKSDKEWKCISVSLIATQSLPNLFLCLILHDGNKTIAVNLSNLDIQDVYKIIKGKSGGISRYTGMGHQIDLKAGFTGIKENGVWKVLDLNKFEIAN